MYCFVGGDRRASYTVEYLREQGLQVCTYGVPGVENGILPNRISTMLLPFPVGENRAVEDLLDRIGSDALVIGGKIGKYRAPLEQKGTKLRDLCDSEPLTTLNGVATAEGALLLLLRESEITLWGSHCLVVGGGRIGMLLGERLSALGAKVCISARKEKDLAMIRARAMESDRTGVYDRGLGEYDFVINTVPAPVLNRAQLERLKPSCFLLELASAPGGFSPEECKALGLKTLSASGLPGLVSPKTAGILYGESILQTLQEEGLL